MQAGACQEEGPVCAEEAKAGQGQRRSQGEQINEGEEVAMTVRVRSAVLFALCALVALAGVCTLARSASAETDGIGWEVMARTQPTNVPPGAHAIIQVTVFALGAGSPAGPITVTDTLPPGLTAEDAGGILAGTVANGIGIGIEHKLAQCSGSTVVTCTLNPSAGLPYFEEQHLQFELAILVHATGGPSTVTNHVTVSGGGANAAASVSEPITISSTLPSLGFTDFDVFASSADGSIDTTAGSHPYEITFGFGLNDQQSRGGAGIVVPSGGEVKNITVNLPPGLIGDPRATLQCTNQQFISAECPNAAQIGVNVVFSGSSRFSMPVYNLVPPPGEPAQFGFIFAGIATLLDSSPRTGSDDGITTHIDDVAQNRHVETNFTTLWGVPADHSHDLERQPCSEDGESCPVSEAVKPLLTMPTQCAGPQTFTIQANTWEDPALSTEASVQTHNSDHEPVGFTGCESLRFEPSITLAPDTTAADSPAGLTVEVRPQVGGLGEPAGASTSDIQNTTVTLPRGVAINPGQAAGLVACQPSQDAIGTEDAPSCPSASKVGTVEIVTPLLPDALEGSVYVLQSNPPNLELLVAVSADGVNLKLVGKVHLDELTGQLTTSFDGTPELPFTDFKLSFSGGAQAALATPVQCGIYTSEANFDPWSDPFVANALLDTSFAIESGPDGGACPSTPLPFSPSLIAGSTTDQAGGNTGFTMLLSRGDGQQRIERLQFKIPPGLSGIIASVPVCDEADANAGTCPASSHVGHVVVTSGPGPYPLVIPQPGDPEAAIYLTGPYKGAPFGLSIVTPVVAGPFNLGTIVTRAAIEVDPRTAQITVTTDPLPQIVDGVPTDLRSVDAVIDRPGFMINPTDCEPSSFSGTAWGTPPAGAGGAGASAAISSPFQVGSCRSLEFKPTLSVSTAGVASKKNGTSLSFKIAYPKGAMGTESWFDEAKFDIPKQLPARLSTIQQACLAATFETDRAACPKHSVIGHALVHTPVLPTPLQGPVYFVSYGGAKFPDAVLVLQGDNVNIELHGNTFIDGSTGVTSATFKALPDVPFESIEVSLPAGEYSEFGANLPAKDRFDFCGQKLTMPTYFKAQNGLEIRQNTPVDISGCAKATLTRAQKLSASLKTCRKDRNKSKRVSCEAQAHKKYGSQRKKK
jgi:hypothetical protein